MVIVTEAKGDASIVMLESSSSRMLERRACEGPNVFISRPAVGKKCRGSAHVEAQGGGWVDKQ